MQYRKYLFTRGAGTLVVVCALAVTQAAYGATLHVDDDNQTGTENGSAAKPYDTVQEAVNAAATSGDVIRIAAGTYPGGTKVAQKEVQLLGGYAGGSAADYAAGTPGAFAVRAPMVHKTKLTGTNAVPALHLYFARTSVADGLVISGGFHGIEIFGDVPANSTPTVSYNLIELNGLVDHNGGGIYASKGGARIIGNVVRNNVGARGAAMASYCDKLVAEGNVFENNIGHDDHGGGVYLFGADIVFTRNLVKGNECCRTTAYGWGGGLLVSESPNSVTKAVLSHNVYTDNKAGSAGSAIFVDDKAEASFDHELVHHNRCAVHGAVIYVDGYDTGSTVTFKNTTVVDNPCPLTGTDAGGMLVERMSIVNIESSVFWNNGGKDFQTDDTGVTINVRYSTTEEPHAGTGNLVTDPLFVGGTDYHVRSTQGRFDVASQTWVTDAVDSPTIDSGDPAAPWELEPGPNGMRVNMGHLGNTGQASMGAAGGVPPSDAGPDDAGLDWSDAGPTPDAGPPGLYHDADPGPGPDGPDGPGPGVDGGCGCSVGGSAPVPAAWFLVALAALALVAARRRS